MKPTLDFTVMNVPFLLKMTSTVSLKVWGHVFWQKSWFEPASSSSSRDTLEKKNRHRFGKKRQNLKRCCYNTCMVLMSFWNLFQVVVTRWSKPNNISFCKSLPISLHHALKIPAFTRTSLWVMIWVMSSTIILVSLV